MTKPADKPEPKDALLVTLPGDDVLAGLKNNDATATSRCLACGHEAATEGDIRDAVYRCDECKNVMFYGQLIIIEPDLSDPARPRVVMRVRHVDREPQDVIIEGRSAPFVVGIAHDLLSLVKA